MKHDELVRIDRREAIKWMLAASASAGLFNRTSFGQQQQAPIAAKGYGTDPDLVKIYKPGDVWPLTFTEQQRRNAAALCDVIIPADEESPNASKLGVHDFVDEWISAPYPGHDKDRKQVLEGLAWLNAEALQRFSKNEFSELTDAQKTAICDDICYVARAKQNFVRPAHFFAKFRNLTAGGFYTTPEGMKDLKYVGNVPSVNFDGPPPEVLKQVGLA